MNSTKILIGAIFVVGAILISGYSEHWITTDMSRSDIDDGVQYISNNYQHIVYDNVAKLGRLLFPDLARFEKRCRDLMDA